MRVRLAVFTFYFLLAVTLIPAPVDAANGDCGQPASNGSSPLASDALLTLRAAVGLGSCDFAVCDVDGNCRIAASDALLILRKAVGLPAELTCNGACSTTTTSTTTTTSSSSSSSLSTTSTSTSSTTTTLPGATWQDVFTIFATRACTNSGCHGHGSVNGGLGQLDNSDAAHANLVGARVGCASSAFSFRVVPGDATASFLMHKLDSSPPDCGSRMPLAKAMLSVKDRDTIRSWINSGAPK